MAGVFQASIERIKSFWGHISFSQRMLIGILAALLTASFFALIVWLNTPDYQPLFTNLGAEDASRVIKTLDAQKEKYKLTANGTAIEVPADRVYPLRVQIAGEGGLLGQGVGFEIFDQVKVGVTDFVQKINYQRALQGELARTIEAFPAVESARVHLVIPQRSLFIEDQQKPSASVVLKLAAGRKMDAKDSQGIVNLLTMSVEGLDKSKVSIVDAGGKVLYQPTEEDALQLTTTQLEHKNLTQQNLERRIEELLMPVVGAGRVIAKVNADLDFSQRTISRKIVNPEISALVSEQYSETATQNMANLESGVPETNFRGDGLGASASTQTSSSENRYSNYEFNKEEQYIVGQMGAVNRLSVAVIVDGTYERNAEGETVFVPRSEEELRQIRQLVANAVGFDSVRGDTIEVSSISFGELDMGIEQNLGDMITDYAVRIGKPLLNAVLIFLFLILVVRPVVLAMIRPKVEGEMVEGLEGLPSGEDRLALVEDSDEAVDALATLEKIEDIKAHSLQLSEQNMEQALGIIRSWLKVEQKANA